MFMGLAAVLFLASSALAAFLDDVSASPAP
jgi:hypothetical protein